MYQLKLATGEWLKVDPASPESRQEAARRIVQALAGVDPSSVLQTVVERQLADLADKPEGYRVLTVLQ